MNSQINVKSENGVRQGGILYPPILNLYIKDIVKDAFLLYIECK